MKKTIGMLFTLVITTFLGSTTVHAKSDKPAKVPPVQDTATSAETVPAPAKEARLKWFREARFGMFIHWGLYSELGGEWNGKPVPHGGEWIMNRAKIPVKEYEKVAERFNPVKFDADAWAQLAQDAGMKYLVFTAKHHDGFAMFDSKVSRFNIVDATPFKRDPVKELAAACAKRGIRFGVYYSQALDWHEANGMGNLWDFGPEKDRDFDEYLRDKSLPQVKELLSNYGPICLIWFDMPTRMTPERTAPFAKLVRSLQPNCLINSRLGKGDYNDYLSTPDGRFPVEEVTKGDWEVPAVMNHTWGFKKDDTDWKTTPELIFNLVNVVSHGGNYLLNMGPDGEGVIPQACADNLRGVGPWLKVNGEAIYGAGPTPFGAEFGAYSPTKKNSHGGPRYFVNLDYRYTSKPGKIYVTFFKWPGSTFTLPEIKGRVLRAYLLADPEHKDLPSKLSDGHYSITLPEKAPDTIASVLCVENQ